MRQSGFEPALERVIECSPRAPSEAREAVRELSAKLDPGALRDAQLVVSELVTNSVRHSGSDEPIHLRAWARPGGVKFEIADGGFGFEPAHPHDEIVSDGGRGLLILDSIAERWGVCREAKTRVWFELAPRPVSGQTVQTA